MILEAEADLVPMGSRSPLRFGRRRADIPPDVLRPIFRMAPVVAGQAPMGQGLASGSVGSWHEVPRTSLAPSSAWLRLLRGRRPWVQGLRSASVGAEQTSPGCLAPHLSHGSGRCGGRRPWFKVSPLHSIFRVKMG